MPTEERPRERLLRLGAERLTDTELVAILIGTGIKGSSVIELAGRLLHHCNAEDRDAGLSHLLRLKASDLKRAIPGVGDAKLCQILAALQLGQRAASARPTRINLSKPQDVFSYLSPQMSYLDHEEFVVILLNAKNNVIDREVVSVGTLTASLVHPREIFKSAVRRSSHGIIVAHNHPSGDPTPSREDYEVTRRLIEAGKLLGIALLDHIIVGDGRYVSFREQNLVNWG